MFHHVPMFQTPLQGGWNWNTVGRRQNTPRSGKDGNTVASDANVFDGGDTKDPSSQGRVNSNCVTRPRSGRARPAQCYPSPGGFKLSQPANTRMMPTN